jgi:hypothetical protein
MSAMQKGGPVQRECTYERHVTQYKLGGGVCLGRWGIVRNLTLSVGRFERQPLNQCH